MKNVSIGTSGSKVYSKLHGQRVDFVAQNLSSNKVYFIESDSQPTTAGIKIPPNGFISKDNWKGDVCFVADGAASDVRFAYQIKTRGEEY